jgi:hypothetical protein
MRAYTPGYRLFCFLLLLLCNATGSAAEEVSIGELSFLDKQYMTQQREVLEELSTRHFGAGFSGDRDRDLSLLQRMLDQRLIRPDQTRELQAMGVIMGDLLAAEFGLQWVIYQDALGRSRALRDGDSDTYLFPITMISRRREAGSRTPVAEIYRKASDIITSSRPSLPFQ